MTFRDRHDAGLKLAAELISYKVEGPIVYGLPRGGVEVAEEVARALEAPLELLLVRKIGVPWQPELAMGAVVDGGTPIVVRNEDVLATIRVSPDAFEEVCARELAEIERRRLRYLGDRAPLDPAGRLAIVIDDGIATGATMTAALRALRQRKPKAIILAVPVAAQQTLERLRTEADRVICLEKPEDLDAIGYFYEDFHQLDDDDVVRLLAQARSTPPRTGARIT